MRDGMLRCPVCGYDAHRTNIEDAVAAHGRLVEDRRVLRAKLEKVAKWLDKNADRCEQAALRYQDDFPSLADASTADAKNYQATARDVRSVLPAPPAVEGVRT